MEANRITTEPKLYLHRSKEGGKKWKSQSEHRAQLCEAAEPPERRGILLQLLMLKVPECLFISRADGRPAISCWPSPSLPLFIAQPRETLNDIGQWLRGSGCKSQIWNAVYSEIFWNSVMSTSHFLWELYRYIQVCVGFTTFFRPPININKGSELHSY